MSWQDDAMAEQEIADALEYMGDAEWRDLYEDMTKPKEFHPDHLKRMGVRIEKGKKEKKKEYNARYWSKHREEICKKKREKYKTDRKKILNRNKQWLKDNKDKWNAYQREYRKRKKEESKKNEVQNN